MKLQRLLLCAILVTGSLLFAAQAVYASTPPASPVLEVKDGGAHCDRTNGPHWAWDVRVIPGSAVTSWSVAAPWTVQNVDGPNANGRLILHLRSDSPITAQPYELSLNGVAYSVSPTLSQGPQTQGGAAPECPQPEPTTTTTTPQETTTTTQAQETTTTTSKSSTPSGGQPTSGPPTIGSSLTVTRSSVPSPPPVVLATSRTSMPNTGAAELIATAFAGAALIAVGLYGWRSGPKPKRGLR